MFQIDIFQENLSYSVFNNNKKIILENILLANIVFLFLVLVLVL